MFLQILQGPLQKYQGAFRLPLRLHRLGALPPGFAHCDLKHIIGVFVRKFGCVGDTVLAELDRAIVVALGTLVNRHLIEGLERLLAKQRLDPHLRRRRGLDAAEAGECIDIFEISGIAERVGGGRPR